MAVLDASFLIDLLRGHPRAIALQDRLEETGEPQIAPAPAIYEVAVELGRRRTAAARGARLLGALDTLSVAPLTREIALDAGRLRGAMIDAGRPADDLDCMIAATALALQQRLVTANRRHFERMPRVRIVSY
jgi:predicted nucleic acid-binding protein